MFNSSLPFGSSHFAQWQGDNKADMPAARTQSVESACGAALSTALCATFKEERGQRFLMTQRFLTLIWMPTRVQGGPRQPKEARGKLWAWGVARVLAGGSRKVLGMGCRLSFGRKALASTSTSTSKSALALARVFVGCQNNKVLWDLRRVRQRQKLSMNVKVNKWRK